MAAAPSWQENAGSPTTLLCGTTGRKRLRSTGPPAGSRLALPSREEWIMPRLIVVLASLAIAIWVAQATFIPLRPAQDLADFGSLLSVLVFASAMLERALDVWLSIVRGDGADALDAELRKLRTAEAGAGGAAPMELTAQVAAKSRERRLYRSATRKLALPVAMLAGTILGALGLRAMAPLFVMEVAGKPALAGLQASLFVAADVLVTGALLAGGSDGIHSLVALYRDWAEKKKDA
jgi:hypothetical protein